jgi:hypothetical protein
MRPPRVMVPKLFGKEELLKGQHAFVRHSASGGALGPSSLRLPSTSALVAWLSLPSRRPTECGRSSGSRQCPATCSSRGSSRVSREHRAGYPAASSLHAFPASSLVRSSPRFCRALLLLFGRSSRPNRHVTDCRSSSGSRQRPASRPPSRCVLREHLAGYRVASSLRAFLAARRCCLGEAVQGPLLLFGAFLGG